jgi:hypothetical protein
MISFSTRDASTAAVEEVVARGASTSSVKAGTCSGDDVEGQGAVLRRSYHMTQQWC